MLRFSKFYFYVCILENVVSVLMETRKKGALHNTAWNAEK